jgi:hypothetical protein
MSVNNKQQTAAQLLIRTLVQRKGAIPLRSIHLGQVLD